MSNVYQCSIWKEHAICQNKSEWKNEIQACVHSCEKCFLRIKQEYFLSRLNLKLLSDFIKEQSKNNIIRNSVSMLKDHLCDAHRLLFVEEKKWIEETKKKPVVQ